MVRLESGHWCTPLPSERKNSPGSLSSITFSRRSGFSLCMSYTDWSAPPLTPEGYLFRSHLVRHHSGRESTVLKEQHQNPPWVTVDQQTERHQRQHLSDVNKKIRAPDRLIANTSRSKCSLAQVSSWVRLNDLRLINTGSSDFPELNNIIISESLLNLQPRMVSSCKNSVGTLVFRSATMAPSDNVIPNALCPR